MSLVYTNPQTQSQLRRVFQDLNVCIANLTAAVADVGTKLGVAGEVLAVGEVVRDNGSGAWVKAQADTLANASAIGIVQSITGLDVRIAQSDIVITSGLTAGTRYFLSGVTSGAIVSSPDTTTSGAVAIVVGYALSSTELFVAFAPPMLF